MEISVRFYPSKLSSVIFDLFPSAVVHVLQDLIFIGFSAYSDSIERSRQVVSSMQVFLLLSKKITMNVTPDLKRKIHMDVDTDVECDLTTGFHRTFFLSISGSSVSCFGRTGSNLLTLFWRIIFSRP